MLEVIGYLLAILMGVTLGIIGGGGSILTVPILVYFFNITPVIATAYSLLLVGITALIGAIRYYKHRLIDNHAVIIFSIPSLFAVYITRKWLVPSLPDPFFMFGEIVISKDDFILLLFSLLMILAAMLMMRNRSRIKPELKKKIKYHTLFIAIEGIFVGILTGVVGAGGGFLIIPVLVLLTGLTMKVAVGSSLLIIAIKSLIGFIGDLQTGIILNYKLLFLFLACTIIGIIFGTIISKKVSEKVIKKIFGWFTLLLGMAIILKEI